MTGVSSGPVDTERARTLWFALLLTLANGFLDAHTYLARGGVFANVQTANVIFSAIDLFEGKAAAALAHVWPLMAFITGMLRCRSRFSQGCRSDCSATSATSPTSLSRRPAT